MQIYTKAKEEITAGMLDCGDTFESASKRIFMVVEGDPYIIRESPSTVLLVNLKDGTLDSISKDAVVRPINLVATEE